MSTNKKSTPKKSANKKPTPKKPTPKKPAPKKPANKKKSTPNKPTLLPLWRVAEVKNPKTGRIVSVSVKKDGTQTPRFSYLPPADEYTVVRASGWAEARAKVKAGEGDRIVIR